MAARDNDAKTADAGRLEADIEQLKADLQSLNESLRDLGRDSLAAARSEGAARLETLRQEADDLTRKLKAKGQNQFEALEAQVRERPLLTLLAAFGLGLIISRLLDRR